MFEKFKLLEKLRIANQLLLISKGFHKKRFLRLSAKFPITMRKLAAPLAAYIGNFQNQIDQRHCLIWQVFTNYLVTSCYTLNCTQR